MAFKDKYIKWRNKYVKRNVLVVEGKGIYQEQLKGLAKIGSFTDTELKEFNKLNEQNKQQFLSDFFNFYMVMND